MAIYIPSEDFEAKEFAKWCETHPEVKFSHLAQETRTDSITARNLKLMGVKRGVPDYMLIVCGQLCFIELKRTKGGVASKYQRDWARSLAAVGAPCFLCPGADCAITCVTLLLEGKWVKAAEGYGFR